MRAAAAAFSGGGRFKAEALVYNNKLWVIGGYFTNEVWNSTDGATWNLVNQTSPLRSLYNHSSAVFDGGNGEKMWVICGNIEQGVPPTNEVWSSADGQEWGRDLPSGLTRRFAHSSVVFNNKLWVIGGVTGAGDTSEVWSSSDGSAWDLSTIAPFTARHNHTSVVFDSKIWLIGGYNLSTTFYNDVWYSPKP